MDVGTETPVVARVRALVEPIASDLGLDLYDLELRGGTLRVTLDTPASEAAGVTLDLLSLASRLVSKELDAHDPIPSRYTLEVTSPGIERSLRTPAHFQRAVGEEVSLRLHDVEASERRVRGVIQSADEQSVTVEVGAEARSIPYLHIDRARTVFEWIAQPKPGTKRRTRDGAPKPGADDQTLHETGDARAAPDDRPEGVSRTGKETPP